MEAESFDKKIRELLDGADFPYQEADWQQAQALLQKERKRKGLWWLWLLPALVGGTAWWMLLPSQAETQPKSELRMQIHATAEQPEHTNEPTQAIESTARAAKGAIGVEKAQNRTAESTPLPPAFALSGKNSNARMVKEAEKAADMFNTADEAAARAGFIAYLQARTARLQGESLHKPAPTERAVEPFHYERPQAKSAPVWMLGLYAASQPSQNQNGEKGASRLNWQAGALASLQFSNGFYGQWLTGIQQQGLRNWTYDNAKTTYDFGFERSTQTLELRDYWTLQNALHLGFARANHRIFASLSYQHYFISRYRLSTQVERQDAPAASQTEFGLATWQQAGMQRFLPGLGYQYDLSPAFRLGLQYQFRNVSSNNYALPAAAPWQFSLQYHLFQRQQP